MKMSHVSLISKCAIQHDLACAVSVSSSEIVHLEFMQNLMFWEHCRDAP